MDDEELDIMSAADEELDIMPAADEELDIMSAADEELDIMSAADEELDIMSAADEELDIMSAADEELDIMDMDYSKILEEMKEKYEAQIREMRREILVLTVDKCTANEKHEEALNKMREEHSKELKDLENINTERLLEEQKRYEDLQQEFESMKVEFEKRIKNMEAKNDIAIWTLEKENERKLKEKSLEMSKVEEKLRKSQKRNSDDDEELKELLHRLYMTEEEVRKKMQMVRKVETLVHRFQGDLQYCVGLIQEPKQLKERVKEMYQRYVPQPQKIDLRGEDLDNQKEFARQREHMERCVAQLKKELANQRALHQAAKVKAMQENTVLMKQINELRSELMTVCSQIQSNQTKQPSPPPKTEKKPVMKHRFLKCSSTSVLQHVKLEKQPKLMEIRRLDLKERPGRFRSQHADRLPILTNFIT